MNIIISEEAKEILDYRNTKKVTIYGIMPVGCWGIQKAEVYVRLREPKRNHNIEDFIELDAEGIHFYIDKTLELPDTITLVKAKYISDLHDKEFEIKEY